MIWLAPLLGILGQLPGVFGDFFKKQSAIAEAQLNAQVAIAQAQVAQATAMARAQLDYQTAALQATTPIFKQRIFWFLSIPIILSVVYPPGAVELWHNLALIPQSYWSLYSAIVLTIWGIPVASNLISSVFSGFTSYTAVKRADKIELQKVSNDQYKAAFFDALRGVKGSLNSTEVANIEQVLDQMSNSSK